MGLTPERCRRRTAKTDKRRAKTKAFQDKSSMSRDSVFMG